MAQSRSKSCQPKSSGRRRNSFIPGNELGVQGRDGNQSSNMRSHAVAMSASPPTADTAEVGELIFNSEMRAGDLVLKASDNPDREKPDHQFRYSSPSLTQPRESECLPNLVKTETFCLPSKGRWGCSETNSECNGCSSCRSNRTGRAIRGPIDPGFVPRVRIDEGSWLLLPWPKQPTPSR